MRVRDKIVVDRAPLAPGRIGPRSLPQKTMRDTLPAERGITLPVYWHGGEVVYVDAEHARTRGIEVPDGNQVTSAVRQEVLNRLGYTTKPISNAPTATAFASRYRVVGDDGGDGRSFELAEGDWVKGGGATPLIGAAYRMSSTHSNGKCLMRESLREVVLGTVGDHDFPQGSTRTWAIIDHGEDTARIDTGAIEPQASMAREGVQHLRPAHFTRGGYLSFTEFNKGEFKKVAGRRMRGWKRAIPKAHGAMSARAWRMGWLFGALNESNTGLFAGHIDMGTPTPLGRRAPQYVLTPDMAGDRHIITYCFGSEYRNRFEIFDLGFPGSGRALFARAYKRDKNFETLQAAGLRFDVAIALQKEAPVLATRLRKLIKGIGKWHGPTSLSVNAKQEPGIFDAFNLLRLAAPTLFATPSQLNAAFTRDALDCIMPAKGETPPESWRLPLEEAYAGREYLLDIMRRYADQSSAPRINKYMIRSPEQVEAKLEAFDKDFVDTFKAVMQTGEETALRIGAYPNAAAFRADTCERALTGNEKAVLLERKNLDPWADAVSAAWRQDHNPRAVEYAVNDLVAHSVRDVSAMLTQGTWAQRADHIAVQQRWADGVGFEVRRYQDGRNTVATMVPANRFVDANIARLSCSLSRANDDVVLEGLLDKDLVVFELPVELYQARVLDSQVIHGDGTHSRLEGYAFAVPDERGLEWITQA